MSFVYSQCKAKKIIQRLKDMDINASVTLVIRAPNQRIEDHTVECMLGWTVKMLKKHLEDVYPSNPKETQQRLIYSGKLLADEMTLKEIIIQNEEKVHHTVHLVCSPSVDHSYNESLKTLEKAAISNVSSTHIPTNTHNTEGLRQRIHQSQSQPVTIASNTTPHMQPPSLAMPNPGVALTSEQYMMMMQNYYYQVATQYMQYYQPGPYQHMAGTVTPEPENEVPQDNNQEPPAARPENANPVMNAQGGVDEDEDDEFGQRDWLDYVYTFSRFLVLISIVYFYSNFTRFLAVAAFFFFVYLYQTGWFTVRRRNPEAENELNERQEQPQQTEAIPRDPGTEGNTEQAEGSQESETPQPEAVPQEPEEPPAPRGLALALSFFTTFFTSLIPEPPAPVNVN
uniref:Homocysteine-responsive endoplasmic reticulum-resident ubiquitin-like domain member 2 protein isoform X1 n=2 Tax=Crassostrea virginica TaxID=6565 RepID=A0A8B8ESM1_CRAVI|nr:homocysteine-responsive endoplasmic reticulum-resident ubiquitin-like domain member 2 protein isoform X1 [Crassostrea virginica]